MNAVIPAQRLIRLATSSVRFSCSHVTLKTRRILGPRKLMHDNNLKLVSCRVCIKPLILKPSQASTEHKLSFFTSLCWQFRKRTFYQQKLSKSKILLSLGDFHKEQLRALYGLFCSENTYPNLSLRTQKEERNKTRDKRIRCVSNENGTKKRTKGL